MGRLPEEMRHDLYQDIGHMQNIANHDAAENYGREHFFEDLGLLNSLLTERVREKPEILESPIFTEEELAVLPNLVKWINAAQ